MRSAEYETGCVHFLSIQCMWATVHVFTVVYVHISHVTEMLMNMMVKSPVVSNVVAISNILGSLLLVFILVIFRCDIPQADTAFPNSNKFLNFTQQPTIPCWWLLFC